MAQPIDRHTHTVTTLLREAVATSAMSQTAFARALGTSGPRLSTYLSGDTRPSAHFLVRAQRLGRALGAVAGRGLMSAPITATLMREHLRADEVEWVWRALLQGRDHLALILDDNDQELIASWEAEPTTIGSAHWDALLAAITAHEFEQAGPDTPSWAQVDALKEPWMPEHPFLSPKRVKAQTPHWLRRHNIPTPRYAKSSLTTSPRSWPATSSNTTTR